MLFNTVTMQIIPCKYDKQMKAKIENQCTTIEVFVISKHIINDTCRSQIKMTITMYSVNVNYVYLHLI